MRFLGHGLTRKERKKKVMYLPGWLRHYMSRVRKRYLLGCSWLFLHSPARTAGDHLLETRLPAGSCTSSGTICCKCLPSCSIGKPGTWRVSSPSSRTVLWIGHDRAIKRPKKSSCTTCFLFHFNPIFSSFFNLFLLANNESRRNQGNSIEKSPGASKAVAIRCAHPWLAWTIITM